jgi:hypothetical protein
MKMSPKTEEAARMPRVYAVIAVLGGANQDDKPKPIVAGSSPMSASDRKKPDRDAILSRRKLFIASTLAATMTTECKNPFRPCLEIAPVDSTAPMPCLSPPPMALDASATATDAGDDAGEADASDGADAADASRDAARDAARRPTTAGAPRKPPPRPCLMQLPIDIKNE